MRISKKLQKLVFSCAFIVTVVWFMINLRSPWVNESEGTETRSEEESQLLSKNENFGFTPTESSMVYILQWTKPTKEPYTFMKEGSDIFFERKCSVKNCYVTWNNTFLGNVTQFDAILFYSHVVSSLIVRLPNQRSLQQYYVFVSTEAAGNNPVYHKKYEHFFNLTWTYKLNSDVFYGYIQVENKLGNIVGPKELMHWPKIEEMKPIDDKLREKLNSKRIAAAWFVSNCHTRSKRMGVAIKIRQELAKYNMTVDVYGHCGLKLPPNISSWELVERDYYFYFSFENALSEDYVTEKLLNALWHYTVPIVLGGANYTRFMPDGIYLNAGILSAEELVKQMVDLINDKEKYYDLFRWHNHYNYYYAGETPETDYYCNFCKKINYLKSINYEHVYKNFFEWWNDNDIVTIY